MVRRHFVLAALLFGTLVVGASPAPAEPAEAGVTVTVLGARVEPLKLRPGGLEAKGKPWDADHKVLPNFVYRQIGPAVGLPPLALFALIPYRNRPDPYVVVRAGEEELVRSAAVQGSFAPTWATRFTLPPPADRTPTIVFEVFDDDLRTDDRIGQAVVETETLAGTTGRRLLEGTGGLHDLDVLVRDPAAATGEEVLFVIRAVHVKARPRRPAGGDWDAGGNPLRRRFPRLRLPEKLEGLPAVHPDLRVRAHWGSDEARTSALAEDVKEIEWSDIDWRVAGRPGTGDGLLLHVTDVDVLLSDPVGLVYVPVEEFIAAVKKGVVVVEPDEWNGVERVEVTFDVRDE